jgi:uncharacterized membrane protein (DUF106 family)
MNQKTFSKAYKKKVLAYLKKLQAPERQSAYKKRIAFLKAQRKAVAYLKKLHEAHE